MDAFAFLFGLIVWFFALLGAMAAGKKALRAVAGYMTKDPEGFRSLCGVPASAEPSR